MNERVVDETVIARARRRDGCCLLGLYTQDGCVSGFDAHHIATRGSGGDDALENLVCLCRRHHNLVHAGVFSQNQLRWLLWRYWRYDYEVEQLTPITPTKPKKTLEAR
jgi:hypothetical protein